MKKLISTGILFLTFLLALSFTTALADGSAINSFSPQIFERHSKLVDNGYVFMDLDKHDLTMAKGKTVKLKAFINPSGKSITVDWKSSNPKIAKVSSTGKVTAVAPGTAIIRIFSSTYKALYDPFGYSDECFVTVQGGSKDAKPIGTSDRTYSYKKTKHQAPTGKYKEALALVKKSIGGNAYSSKSEKINFSGLMYGSKDIIKAHTVIYICAYEDGNYFGYGFGAREKSPIKTSRGIAVEAKKSVIQQKYGLPTFTEEYTNNGNTYEILSYQSKAAGKNLYTRFTFHILKSKGTVSMIQFYCGG